MTKPPDPARRAATMLALLLAAPCAAQADVLVGTGSTVHFADASIDFGCGNLIVGGTADSTSASLGAVRGFSLTGGAFALGSGTLALGGDFANAGKFAPGIGMVAVGDACGNGASTFSGANNFHALSITTTTGKQAIFPAGLAQNVTHALTLQGTPGNLLRIASSSAGQQGVLALAAGAAQNIAYVDARDNDAGVTPIAPGAASLYSRSTAAISCIGSMSAAVAETAAARRCRRRHWGVSHCCCSPCRSLRSRGKAIAHNPLAVIPTKAAVTGKSKKSKDNLCHPTSPGSASPSP